MRKKRKLWRRSVGERPCTVTAFERGPNGVITLRWWAQDKYVQKALGHDDRDKAIAEALDTAAKLQRGEQASKDGETTLAKLFREYETHRTPRKSAGEQRADARRIDMWTRVLGAERPVASINLAAWETFIDDRRSGRIDARGRSIEARVGEWEDEKGKADGDGEPFAKPRPEKRPAGPRTVEADLKWLQLVVGWATKWRDHVGRPLVAENVLRGLSLPKEKNPRRPVASTNRLEALLAVTDQVSPDLTDLLVLANATGQRLSAILGLRQDDVNLAQKKPANRMEPGGSIRWRAENDKTGKEKVVPIDAPSWAAIKRIRERRPAIGTALLFPSPKDDSKPMSRHLADRMLRRAERLAKLEPQKGSLWHAYRRAWATARKHLPVVDVAAAGGWATTRMVTVYQQADPETTLRVVLGGAEIREVNA